MRNQQNKHKNIGFIDYRKPKKSKLGKINADIAERTFIRDNL